MMRKIFPLIVVLAVMAGALMAQENKGVTLTGYLVDNNCSASHVTDKTFATWVKTHGTDCSKMEACEKSGYAVFAGDKLYKLDDKGNESAEALLKATKSKKGLKVKAEGTVDGETLKITKMTEVTE